MPKATYTRILATILFIALLLRVLVVAAIPTIPTSDFWSYFQRAISLADSGIYQAVAGRPDASYPPAYPLLLSLFFRLPLERLLAAKLVNLTLGLVSILLMAAVTRRLFGDHASLFASAALGMSPTTILSTVLLASEHLFIPLVLGWVLVMLPVRRARSQRRALYGGILIGLASLARAVSFLMSVPWLLSQLPLKPKPRALLGSLGYLVAAQLAVMLPWAIRNSVTLGTSTFLTTTAGVNLFIGNNPNATGYWYPWTSDIAKVEPSFTELSIVEQDKIAAGAAIRWMVGNPMAAVSLYAAKWALMFKDDRFPIDAAILDTQVSPPWPASDALPGDHPVKAHASTVAAVADIYYWIFLLLGLGGVIYWLVLSWGRSHSPFRSSYLLLVLTAGYFPAVSACFLASTRFRWPTTILLIPFAAAAIDSLIRLLGARMPTRAA